MLMKGKQLIKKLRALGVEIEKGRGKVGHVQARFNDKKGGNQNSWRKGL